MNKLIIIGNLTHDPELRQTQSGIPVCTFTVAVNRRRKAEGQPDADFFRVTTWRDMAKSCAQYLSKGRKVACEGTVSLNVYERDGKTYASMEMSSAESVEFVSPRPGGAADDENY